MAQLEEVAEPEGRAAVQAQHPRLKPLLAQYGTVRWAPWLAAAAGVRGTRARGPLVERAAGLRWCGRAGAAPGSLR
jgi:hypothetical protein